MKTILLFVVFSCYSIQHVIANNVEFTNSGSYGDLISKMHQQNNEMQQLINRIEHLEHEVSILKNKSNPELSISNNVTEDISNEIDVFDVPVLSSEVMDSKDQEKELYDESLILLKDGKFAESENKFAEFIKKYPSNTMQSNAHFWYAETFFRRKMFDKSAINFAKGYKQFPKGAKAADSLFKLSLSLGELDKLQEACDVLSKLDSDFPNREAASIKRAQDLKTRFGCKI